MVTQPFAIYTSLSSYPPFEHLMGLAIYFLKHSLLLAIITLLFPSFPNALAYYISFLFQLAPTPPLKYWQSSGLSCGSSSLLLLFLPE